MKLYVNSLGDKLKLVRLGYVWLGVRVSISIQINKVKEVNKSFDNIVLVN